MAWRADSARRMRWVASAREDGSSMTGSIWFAPCHSISYDANHCLAELLIGS
jgi:hypothetical protein